ncbi:MAG: peptide/nickel transport system permease protein [Microbacteriaceae bacterium]|jgi:ABC-type dipeptide/oligopeptide/nickel transport system permease subunit|nr:peptide/nickel transport system permease protein [Microbacteriaceae bacterium]
MATIDITTVRAPMRILGFRWPFHGVIANGVIGFLLFFVFLAIFGEFISPYAPNRVGVGPALAPPSPQFWFGTDGLGRDQLSRVIASTRPALLSATEAVSLALVVGLAIGIAAGYLGGWWDGALSRIMDLLFAFPEYLLAILVVAVLGSGLTNVAIGVGIICIPRFARAARSATMEVISRGYVEAAVLAGRSRAWIMWRHVLPNIASPLLVMTAITLSTAEGAYASLAFLGFGERPPTADLGSMISAAQPYMTTNPFTVLFPAAVFVVLVLAFNVLGDVLRDLLDPRARPELARSIR